MIKFAKWNVLRSLFILFFCFGMMSSPVFAGKLKAPDLSDPAMDFVMVRSANDCEPLCTEWLSAEGRIDRGSTKLLKAAIKALKGRKIPVVLRSGGGDVEAAMAMGRLIRKAGLPVYIGGTVLKGCPDADLRCKTADKVKSVPVGGVYATGATCFSACPLMLGGGTVRKSGAWSLVGVHQITVGLSKIRIMYKMRYLVENGKKKLISKREVSRQTLGTEYNADTSKAMKKQLNGYWKEMGINPQVTDLMQLATPDSIHLILPKDLLDLKLLSVNGTAEELNQNNCKDKMVDDRCVNSSDL